MDENYLKGEIRAALERIQVNCKLWVTKELCLEFDKYAVELAKVMLAQAYNPYNPYNPPTPLLDKARADQAEFAERQKPIPLSTAVIRYKGCDSVVRQKEQEEHECPKPEPKPKKRGYEFL